MRKINFVKLFLSLMIFNLFFSCASTKSINTSGVPEWILSPSSVYDDSKYLSAVGYGEDRASAELSAIAAITKVIKQQVNSETVSNENFTSVEGNWTTGRDVTSSVQTQSDLVISGIYIQDVYPVKKGKTLEYYALALINREETGNLYKSKIAELTPVIDNMIVEAYKNMGSFSSYGILSQAAQLAAECDLFLDMLAVINPTYYKMSIPDYGNAATVEELARRCLSQIVIGFDIKGDIDGRVAAAFSKIFSEYGIKLASIEDEDATYTLVADVSFSPLQMSGETKNKYIRFVVNANLTELKTDKIVLPFAISGREAHLSEEEATQRAVRTIENEIRKQFQSKVYSLF